MNEIWKDIKGYEGYSQASKLGNIKSMDRYVNIQNGERLAKGYLLKPAIKKGYETVVLSKERNNKHISVHRLVAQAFIPNPENKRTVNHKDGNKLNNHIDNLEWNTYKENMQHAIDIGLTVGGHPYKKVLMKTLNEEPLLLFESIKEAGEATGIWPSSINGCCRKKKYNKTAGGYKWEYA